MRVRRLREAGALVTLIVVKFLGNTGKQADLLVAEGKILFNPVFVGGMDCSGSPQGAAALWIFGLQQVAFAGTGTQHFAARGNLEPLGYRLLCLNAFWT